MPNTAEKPKSLLLVDDESTNLQLLRQILQADYRLLFAKDGPTALQLATDNQPDLILLDIMMPSMSGYEVCESLKDNAGTRSIPVIFVTALNDTEDETQGLKVGAVDYITKPFNPPIVQARVRTHLSLVNAERVWETQLHLIQSLSSAAEYRDNETGRHVVRIGHYSRRMAKAVGYSDDAADELLYAAQLHDVGKIGIPDSIMCKPGRLDADEWAVMRQHPIIGAQIIGGDRSSLLRLASSIAMCHHEKWDGSGYPTGLAGEAIPYAARIVAVVDVFDALTSVRPYKRAWPIDDAVALIEKESGHHFDPELVLVFKDCLPDILSIRDTWADTAEAVAVST